VLVALDAIKAATGRGPYAATGHTLGDIRKMKPKELTALLERVEVMAADAAKAA